MSRKPVFYVFAPNMDTSNSVTVVLNNSLNIPEKSENSIIFDRGSHPFSSIALEQIRVHIQQYVAANERIDIWIIIWTHGVANTGNFLDQNGQYQFEFTPELFYGLFLNEIINESHNNANINSVNVLAAQCYGNQFANSLMAINPRSTVQYFGLSSDTTSYISYGNATIGEQTLHPQLVSFINDKLKDYVAPQ